jgi:hypothetical protein
MLFDEFGFDKLPSAREAVEAGRERWRRMQIATLVRDAPDEAVRTLKELGYTITDPPDGPRPVTRRRFADAEHSGVTRGSGHSVRFSKWGTPLTLGFARFNGRTRFWSSGACRGGGQFLPKLRSILAKTGRVEYDTTRALPYP